jgi:excisionase family DNA binding protein
MPSVSPHDELVTIAEAAALLNVSIRTVARLQSDGTLPPVYLTPVRKARIRRFRRMDVERLLPAPIKAAS